jgi:hypothetical protein
MDLSHGSSTFPKFLSLMRQLSPRKAICKKGDIQDLLNPDASLANAIGNVPGRTSKSQFPGPFNAFRYRLAAFLLDRAVRYTVTLVIISLSGGPLQPSNGGPPRGTK